MASVEAAPITAVAALAMMAQVCNYEKLTGILKLNLSQYPAIHTTYMLHHCTYLQYNHNIHGSQANAKF